MRNRFNIAVVTALWCALSAPAQPRQPSASAPLAGRAALPATNATGDYASDVGVVVDAQDQVLAQARQMLEEGGDTGNLAALEAAVKQMERSRAALEEARKSPEKLPAAIAAEQSAYQALLKATPREYRMSRSRGRGQSSGSSAGQPNQQQLDQLEMTTEENRYETERQATANPTQQQSQQAQTVDRLKQLARRQQDLNDRLRSLQTALQEARTEQERADIQRQLKRLRDEERQMLSDVDELRQRLEQSPDAARQADARQQLEQTRSDVQNAAQQLDRQSVSEALAAGSRAEENLQNLRENLRQQSSSQFSEQMRQMRSHARDLADRENQIARDLDALNNSAQKQLDDSAQRQPLVEQMTRQQSALTNLLGGMRAVTEQAEMTEPLLSKQLYDIIRRADQMHTDSQLEIGARLVERGFLPQASQAESAARTNINELRQSVDRAAESVLGSETEALRYAQRELEDLAGQMAREMSRGTNSSGSSAGARSAAQAQTNSQATAQGRGSNRGGNGREGTNAMANAASESGRGNPQGRGEQPASSQNPQTAGRDGGRSGAGNRGNSSQANAGQGQGSGSPSAGQEAAPEEGQEVADARGGNGRGRGQARSAQNQPNVGRNGGPGGENNPADGTQAQGSGNPSGEQDAESAEGQPGPDGRGGRGGLDRLRQVAQQIGGGRGGLGPNGPITGNNYLDWSERLRDVEQAVASQDVRNQLATVRERVGVYRQDYRVNGRAPSNQELQDKVIVPLALAKDWVEQELSRAQNEHSLVPLDRDPVQEKYSDLVRQYYEKLGNP